MKHAKKDTIVFKATVVSEDTNPAVKYPDQVKQYLKDTYGDCEMLISEHQVTDNDEQYILIMKFKECNHANRIKQSYNGRLLFNCRVYTNFIDAGQYEEKGLAGIEFADNPLQATSTKKKKKSKAVETTQKEWMIKQGFIVPEEEPQYDPTSYEQPEYQTAYSNVFYSEFCTPTPSPTPPPYGPYSPPPSSIESILQYEKPDSKLDFYRSEKEYTRPSIWTRENNDDSSTYSDHNWISKRSGLRSRWDSQSPDRRGRKRHYSSSSASSMDYHGSKSQEYGSIERTYRIGDSSYQSSSSHPPRFSYDNSSGRWLSYSADGKEWVQSDLPHVSRRKDDSGAAETKKLKEEVLSEGEVNDDSNEGDGNPLSFSLGNCLAILRGEEPETKKEKDSGISKGNTDADSKRDADDTRSLKDHASSGKVRSRRASADDNDDADGQKSKGSKKRRRSSSSDKRKRRDEKRSSREKSDEKRSSREKSDEKRSSRKKKHKRRRSSSSDYEQHHSRDSSRTRREKRHKDRKNSKDDEVKEKQKPEKASVEEISEVRKRKAESSTTTTELPVSKKIAVGEDPEQGKSQDASNIPLTSVNEIAPNYTATISSPSLAKDPVPVSSSSPTTSSTPVPIMIPFYLPYPPEYLMNQMALAGQCPVLPGATQWSFQNTENSRSRSGTPVMDEPPAEPKTFSTTQSSTATPSPKTPPANISTASAMPTTVPSSFPGYIIPTPFFTGSNSSQTLPSPHVPMMMTLPPNNPYLPPSTTTSSGTITRPIASLQPSPQVVSSQTLTPPNVPDRDNIISLVPETSTKQGTEEEETQPSQKQVSAVIETQTETEPISSTAVGTSSKLAETVIKLHEDSPEPVCFDAVRSSTPVATTPPLTLTSPRVYTEAGTQTMIEPEGESVKRPTDKEKMVEEENVEELELIDDMEEPPSPLANTKVPLGTDFNLHKSRILKEFNECADVLIASSETLASHNPNQADAIRRSLSMSLKGLARQLLLKFRLDTGIIPAT